MSKMAEKCVVTLAVVECAGCGVPFGLTTSYEQARRSDRQGHWQWFPGKTPEELLKEKQAELDRQKIKLSQAEADARYQRDRREQTERQLSATKGVVTRLKNRAAAGVCPAVRVPSRTSSGT